MDKQDKSKKPDMGEMTLNEIKAMYAKREKDPRHEAMEKRMKHDRERK